MTSKPHLIVTWALDKIGKLEESIAAKLLVSSLIRSFVNCQILVYRRGESPLFLVDRLGVIELAIDSGDQKDFEPLNEYRGKNAPCPWDFYVSDHIDIEPFDKVLFLSPHCLALRSIDHLLAGDWDVAWQPLVGVPANDPAISGMLSSRYIEEFCEPVPLASAHFVAIRASILDEVLMEWRKVHEAVARDYGENPIFMLSDDDEEEVVEWKSSHTFFESWNCFLRLTRLNRHRVEKGEVRFPLWLDPRFPDYCDAALLAPDGGSDEARMRLFYSLYMGTFFNDPDANFLQFLEM